MKTIIALFVVLSTMGFSALANEPQLTFKQYKDATSVMCSEFGETHLFCIDMNMQISELDKLCVNESNCEQMQLVEIFKLANTKESNRTVWAEYQKLIKYVEINCPSKNKETNVFCRKLVFDAAQDLVKFCMEYLGEEYTVESPKCQTITMKSYDEWFVKKWSSSSEILSKEKELNMLTKELLNLNKLDENEETH